MLVILVVHLVHLEAVPLVLLQAEQEILLQQVHLKVNQEVLVGDLLPQLMVVEQVVEPVEPVIMVVLLLVELVEWV